MFLDDSMTRRKGFVHNLRTWMHKISTYEYRLQVTNIIYSTNQGILESFIIKNKQTIPSGKLT